MENGSQMAKSSTPIPGLDSSQNPHNAAPGLHPIGRFNSRLALIITKSVGSMWCAYLFAMLAMVSLPAAISSHDPIIIVSWIAQTFLQLVLLPIIIVGQNVLAAASDARAESDHKTLLAIRALSLIQLGEQQLEARNIRSALRTYQEAYELDPYNPATSYFLGYLYTETRQIDKGIDYLKRALALNEQYPPAEGALAYALRLQADKSADPEEKKLRYAESEKMFLRALSEDPTMRDINGESFYALLGGLYKRLDRIDEAIEAYTAAELVTPQNSYPIFNLATLYYLRGDLEQAKPDYERCVEISSRMLNDNPFDFWRRFDLSAAQLVLGDLEQAKRQFTLAAQQVRHPGPLETVLHDLERLKAAPVAPKGVGELIELARNAIKRIESSSAQLASASRRPPLL
jgi:tetratricopeptide (TPR) repeat protein